MPQSKERKREYMKPLMAEKRGTNKEVLISKEGTNIFKVVSPSVSLFVIVLSDGQVYQPIGPDLSVSPSKAYPRQPNKCIRCGSRIPPSDNFCSDLHYKEHLAWLQSRLWSGQEGQQGVPQGGMGGMIHPRILELKAMLDGLRSQHAQALDRQDWAEFKRISEDMEPLMKELFKLTKGLGYWFPARFYGEAH